MRNRGEGVTDERPTSTTAIVPRRRLLTRTVSFYGASSLSRNGGYDVQPVGGSSRQPFSSRDSHGNQCSYLTSSLCLLSSPCFKSNSSNPFWEGKRPPFTILNLYLYWNQRDTNCPARRSRGRALASSLAIAASEGTNAIHPATFTHVNVLDICSASSRPARHCHRSPTSRQNGTRQNGRPPVHA